MSSNRDPQALARLRWIDSHCHLQDRYRAEGTVEQVAVEAVGAGVGGLICVGTDAQSSLEALNIAEELRDTQSGEGSVEAWATIGLHPHDASRGTSEVEALVPRAIGEHPDVVVAVGECGLDYHYEHSPKAAQREAFRAQVALARENQLTLVVHTREAWDDTFDVLSAQELPERIVFHCFTGGPSEARRCLEIGAFLSFSGIVTFKNASESRDALRICPLERLLVETDAPFLAPVPHRGKQNRPAWVSVVGEAVADVKSLSVEEVATSTQRATRTAFGIVSSHQ